MTRTAANTPRRRGAKPDPAPTTPDPVEMAMVAEASGRTPTGIAAEFLVEQKRLTRWQVANERAAFALRMLTGLAGLVAAMVLAAMVWTASQSRSMVINAFSAPPELAARGITGQVVANRILDGMTAIQARIDSQRAPSSFSRAWDGGIQVEIPSTGITAAELMRELRAWLGHDRHVGGEVVRTPEGLAVTVRLAGGASATFDGPEADLPALLARAAEGAYAMAEPYRWANQLRSEGRFTEAAPIFRSLAASGTASDRGWALMGLGNIARDMEGQRASFRYQEAAARIAPWQHLPVSNKAYISVDLGHPARALGYARQAVKLATDRSEVRTALLPTARGRVKALGLQVKGDFLGARRAWYDVVQFGPQGANQSLASRLAWTELALHDVSAARATLAGPDPSQTRNLGVIQADLALTRARVAAAVEDWPEVLSQLDISTLRARYPGLADYEQCHFAPLAAYALARQGDLPSAEARVGTTPLDCYDAVVFRARIAELAGQRAVADHWFGRAVRMAPGIAFARQAWAEAKLARGDLAGALGEARAAEKIAPRFADPRETQGEVLLVQGDAKGAAAKFAQAAKLAPRWGRLHLKWGEALAKLGRADEAGAKWRAAATMDLSAADRAALKAHGI